ncbi:MAG: preprotein translocase subunit SecA [Acidobacteriota bacterium]
MLQKVIDKVIGSKNERSLKKLTPRIAGINELEPTMRALSDDQLRAKTAEMQARAKGGEDLDDLLPEAFAALRAGAERILNMRHYDCQLLGGMVLHEGRIAEMKTGEGKTLVATLPAYLNALSGKGVHVVTTNDYLARRDAEWMGALYRFMGLSVGTVQHDLDSTARREAYGADITYGTNNEFGFDYLRDNMKYSTGDFVQRGWNYALVDEVDSILIDEARTPLIISAPAEEATDKYYQADALVQKLRKEIDYRVNEEANSVTLSEEGIEKVEKLLGLGNIYDPKNIEMLHCVEQALRANALYKRDTDYVIQEGEVVIVDEHTGRLMPGRRWGDGQHQAVEAKEKVKIQRESQTYATVTFQNYFRMYEKLAGMTGTAETEETEFTQIYGLDVVVVPTNKELTRLEHADVIYRTAPEKWRAIVDEIAEVYGAGRPCLVGTTSIEKSEMLSARLKRKGIPHVVLNAKNHAREAEIVAQAGRSGMVTVATNMAGRGTDILLGGSAEFHAGPLLQAVGLSRYEGLGAEYLRLVMRDDLDGARKLAADVEGLDEELLAKIVKLRDRCQAEHDQVVGAGGLHVLGTERHEARRIDNQLRGRAGRQGDPGSSRFFLSLEDDLMRIFASEKMSELMKRLGMEEDVPIESPLVTRAIGNAQNKVEQNNYGIRKHLLQYDDVMNEQRKEIYALRNEILDAEGAQSYVEEVTKMLSAAVAGDAVPDAVGADRWDLEGLRDRSRYLFGLSPSDDELGVGDLTAGDIRDRYAGLVDQQLAAKAERLGPEAFKEHCRILTLRVLDGQWKDHLTGLDALKQGINLRSYAQKDPKMEYKRESYGLFMEMKERIEEETARLVFLVEPVSPEERAEEERRARERVKRIEQQAAAAASPAGPRRVAAADRVGRNDPCSCGSGKKYKRCCGKGR